ncbi:MAG: DUF5362 family protein [Bacteroidia bacterium]
MENNVLDQQMKSGSAEIGLSLDALDYIRQTAKWAKFFAILGFIFCAIMILGGIFAGSMLGTMGGGGALGAAGMGGLVGFVYILFSLLYFFPCLYLYRFSVNAQTAIDSRNTEQMTQAFRWLKSNFRFFGILTIVILSLYLVIAIFALIMAGMR